MRPLRVLYLHPVTKFGGASKSLIELWKVLRTRDVTGVVVCPRGSAAAQFAAHGMQVQPCLGLPQFDNSRYGAYRGARWLVVLRELLLWPVGLLALRRARRLGSFSAIHVNEIQLLPLGLIARRWLRAPLLVHVRSLQRAPDDGLRTRIVNRWLARADAVIAIDNTVRRTLPRTLAVEVVHNGVVVKPEPREARVRPGPFRVAMVGMLIAAKGVYEFVAAAKLCRERGLDVEFLLAGENVRELKGPRRWILGALNIARDVRGELQQMIDELQLHDCVRLLGFVRDVQSLYASIDLLCFPSHLDAAGRPVFEAAFHGVPSLVAATNPEPDTIVHEQTGLCIAARDPQAIADAVERLIRAPEELARMGAAARRLALENFDMQRNAEHVLGVYRELTAASALESPPA
jgi:glycosyltransferase involved in cell wall biosynthesis